MQPHCEVVSRAYHEREEEGYTPAVVVVAVYVQHLLALDTQHTAD